MQATVQARNFSCGWFGNLHGDTPFSDVIVLISVTKSWARKLPTYTGVMTPRPYSQPTDCPAKPASVGLFMHQLWLGLRPKYPCLTVIEFNGDD